MKRATICCIVMLAPALASWSGGVARAAGPTSAPTTAPLAASPVAPLPVAPAPAPAEVKDVKEVARGPSAWWGTDYPQLARGVNLHLPRVTRKLSLELLVDHRTNKPFTENTWHDFFGFDAGALKIGLGLRFGVWDNLDVGVYRLNSATERFDTYQFDAKYHLLHQERHVLDLGLRAGVTWYSQPDAEDAAAFLGELLLARRFFHRLTLGASLLFHTDSTNADKSRADKNPSLALGLIVDLRVLSWLAWNVELGVNLAGYGTRNKVAVKLDGPHLLTSYPVFTTALKIITRGRHTFAFVLSNNPYVSADGLVGNTTRGFDQLILGFTLTREWNF